MLSNEAPVITAGATQATNSPLNRLGTSSSVISGVFSDANIPGVGAFTVTLKIREPNNSTEILLVDNQTHGNGGLTIVDLGGGSYRAETTWDPGDAQALGFYDLYCDVTDGVDSAVDAYANNDNELEVVESPLNNLPVLVAGATQVSVSPVNRYGTETTDISADFTDADSPGLGAFTVTFKIREPNDTTIVTLVSAQTNGNGGLTVIDNGGGSYTASYVYNPNDTQQVGLYDR